MSNGTLSRFALNLYADEDIARLCLAWQDAHNVDITVLLMAAWSGAGGFQLSKADIAAASTSIASWRAEAVQPLRKIRRALKGRTDLAPPEELENLRNKIKAAEVESEMVALRMLEANCPRGSGNVETMTALRASIAAAFACFADAAAPAGDVELIATAAIRIGGGRPRD